MHGLPAADALDVYADTAAKLGSLYVDRDRATPDKLYALGIEELDRAFDDPAFLWRHVNGTPERVAAFRVALRESWRSRRPGNVNELRQTARELVAAAHDQAGMRNPSVIILELIGGACSGLDEYSGFSPATEAAKSASPAAEFAAYGIAVRVRHGELIVDGVSPNSWAAHHTNLRKGQRVVALNGRPLYPATPALLAEALRGHDGFEHEIEVFGSESEAIIADEYRLPIPAPTVMGPPSLLKGGIGVVRLSAFRENTARELDEHVLELQARGMRALVLDLRGNAGGQFPAAVGVASRFLPRGSLVATTRGQAPDFAERSFPATGTTGWEFPVVVLTDTRTMSAAEVVAAALKTHGRATLVGLPTYGKGVVQAPIRLGPAAAGDAKAAGTLTVTVASVHRPDGTPVDLRVIPDILEPDPNKQLDRAVRVAWDMLSGK